MAQCQCKKNVKTRTWLLVPVMWQNYCLLKLFPCTDNNEDTKNTGPIIPCSSDWKEPIPHGLSRLLAFRPASVSYKVGRELGHTPWALISLYPLLADSFWIQTPWFGPEHLQFIWFAWSLFFLWLYGWAHHPGSTSHSIKSPIPTVTGSEMINTPQDSPHWRVSMA